MAIQRQGASPGGSRKSSARAFPAAGRVDAAAVSGGASSLVDGRSEVLEERYWLQVQRLDRTLSSLERISNALTTTTEGVPVLLQTITKTVAEVFDCRFVFLVIKSGHNELCALYPPRSGQSERAEAEVVEQGWCITEQTLLGCGPMNVTCMAREACPCEHVGEVMTVPMSRDGILEGSISLQTSEDRVLDEYDSSILQILANQATVAIQNARLFEESQYLRAQAEELYRVAVEQRHVAERKRRELEMAQDEIDSMEREQIISTERERIARELHDDVAQTLASIGLNLEWCRQRLPAESPVQERIGCLKELARNGLYEIRNAILGLSPTIIADLGLDGALEKLVSDFVHISRIPAEIEVEGAPRPSPNGAEKALYHICQEALYNVFKHAHAQRVQVRLTFEPDGTLLTVADDGIGIPEGRPGHQPSAVTFGLKNMKARAEELGGSLTLGRGDDSGTRVTARIPG